MKPKLRLFSDGKNTYAEICGKSIGKGITAISFSHDKNASDGIKVELEINLNDFGFMKDGFFDECEKKYMEYEPLKAENEERLK